MEGAEETVVTGQVREVFLVPRQPLHISRNIGPHRNITELKNWFSCCSFLTILTMGVFWELGLEHLGSFGVQNEKRMTFQVRRNMHHHYVARFLSCQG